MWRASKERVLKEMHESKSKLQRSKGKGWDEEPVEGGEAGGARRAPVVDDGPTLGVLTRSDIFKPRDAISMAGLRIADPEGQSVTIRHLLQH